MKSTRTNTLDNARRQKAVLFGVSVLIVLRVVAGFDPFASLLRDVIEPVQVLVSQALNGDLRDVTVVSSGQGDEPSNSMSATFVSLNTLGSRKSGTLSVGGRDGVRVDTVVTTEDGVLIGIITEVFAGSSNVQLVGDIDLRIPAYIEGAGETMLVRGEIGGIILTQFDASAELSGQTVYTSGLGDVFPRGLIIAQVGERIESEQAVGSYVVHSPVTPLGLQMVTVELQ